MYYSNQFMRPADKYINILEGFYQKGGDNLEEDSTGSLSGENDFINHK